MRRRILYSVTLPLSTALLFGLVSFAGAVSLSPTTFELSANPGDKIVNYIRVYNDQDIPIGVTMEIENFTASGEEGRVVIEKSEETSNFSLASWVRVTPTDFTIAPHSFHQVEYTVSVPLKAEPGGHYGSILVTVVGAGTNGTGLGISQKLASLLLLNVAGQVKEGMLVRDFSAPAFSEYGPVNMVARFENTGSIHLKPRGFVIIKNLFGKQVAQLDIPQSNILPETVRRVEIPWTEKYSFGKYEATLTAIYGSTNEPLTSSVSFWVIPWKIASVVLLAVLLLIFIFYRSRRRIGLAFRILFKGDAR